MTNEQENWKVKPDYVEKLTIEEAKFILEQAEKQFKDTLEISKRITDRTYTIASIISGILIGLVAYSIGKWDKNSKIDAIQGTAIFGIIYYFLIGVIFIFGNIKSVSYKLSGTQPKNYFVDFFFPDKLHSKGRMFMFYIIEIQNYQKRIESNTETNERRWQEYNVALTLFFISPIILIVVFLMIRYI